MNTTQDTPRVDPSLVAGNRKTAADYKARHFGWSVTDGVATVTLNRPERKNPLTFDSYAELRDLFGLLKYAQDVQVVVITGSGGNFCSGGDVHEIIGPLVRLEAPMSQPARPTRLNRKAVLLRAVPRRRSEDIATMAPAPAHTPSIAATIGCGQIRIALTRSPVIRVNIKSSGALSLTSGPMISWTSPPEQKLPPAPATTTALISLFPWRDRNRSRSSA